MANETVINENEVVIAGTRYPTSGPIRRQLMSRFPPRVSYGDDDYANQQVMSELIMSDQRGGMLIEEMEEGVHDDRYWWSTLQTGFKNHMTLRGLATAGTLPTVTTLAEPTNATMEASTLSTAATQESDDSTDSVEAVYGVNWEAQTFKTEGIRITGVTLRLYRFGAAPGTVSVGIYATSSDKPTGSALTTGTTDGDTLPTTPGELRAVSLTEYELAPTTKYAIVVSAPTGDSNNAIYWHADSSSPAYTDGSRCYSANSGSAWTEDTNEDFCFYVTGKPYTVDDWTGGKRGGRQKQAGTYSLLLNSAESYQDLAWDTEYQGRVFEITVYAYTSTASTGRVAINDGVTTTNGSYHTGGGAWEAITVRMQLAATATRLRIICDSQTAANVYFDTISISEQPVTGVVSNMENFNSELYISMGNILAKLSSGTTFTYVYSFPTTITDLVAAASSLYILIGDSNFYWTMDTAEAFTEGGAYGNIGLSWNSAGNFASTAGVLSSGGDLRNNGLASGDLNSLLAYRDADGETIIYAATKKGLYAHDDTNNKFLETELSMPDQATTGKGSVAWRDTSYISAGLDVMTYQTGQGATTIDSVGLSNDDGLPQTKGGEIVAFIKGYNEFFALLDSTYEGTGSRSTVMGYDGSGWRLWWEAGSDNVAMHCGIVSSKVAYQLWFAAGSSIYSIPLQSNIRNPKKISSFTYEAAGIHILPWFDGGSSVYAKLAKSVRLFAKDTTANETIQVSYRIDHATTNIGSVGVEWTSLGTLVAANDGVAKEIELASGAGLSFKSIQFRFDFARGGTNTLSPDLQSFSLSYTRKLVPVWGYAVNINLAEHERVGTEPKNLYDSLITAVSAGTLQTFNYRDNTTDEKYVMIEPLDSMDESGQDFDSQFRLLCVEP